MPQLLHSENILLYNNELHEIIESKQYIDRNSKIELEIRASTIIVVEKIKEILKIK